MKVLLINSDEGPDYLADLINYFFISNNFTIYTNYDLGHLYKNITNKNNLYGNGFTLYGKLDTALKKNINVLSTSQIYDSLRTYDLIIFTSIHRKFNSHEIKKEIYPKINQKVSNLNLVIVDGEDFTFVDENLASSNQYFKRELTEKFKNLASPISFAFPDLELKLNSYLNNSVSKTQILAPMDPRYLKSYIYENENDYFDQYKKSLFAVTIKKAGWDCMRHYEILACKTIPYFPNISNKPKFTMINYPMKLQEKANDLFVKLIVNEYNFDSLEKIRLQYPSKNYLTRAIKKTKRKLSSLEFTENNLKHFENLNFEFQTWLEKNGTTQIYQKIFKI